MRTIMEFLPDDSKKFQPIPAAMQIKSTTPPQSPTLTHLFKEASPIFYMAVSRG